jgi:hypothetical protein
MPRHTVEEDESYFISMTDLMVGLLFIFIIMLMVFALQYREAERKTMRRSRLLKKQLSGSLTLTKCAMKS